MKQKTGISFFQKYLTVWVLLCMAAGIVIGHFIPVVPEALGRMEIAGISIPIAILIWIMIYPMMIKVDFQSVKEVGCVIAYISVQHGENTFVKARKGYFRKRTFAITNEIYK